jgi:two-component system, NarL family, sensor histidine kinase UhpB
VNLKAHLLLQIILVAVICLMATGAYVLLQTNRQIKLDAAITLDAVGKYLEIQLLQIDANLQDSRHFPDFDLWKQTHAASGVCLHYVSDNRQSSYGLCQGEDSPTKRWPGTFETLYRQIFSPGLGLTRPLSFKGEYHGYITVIPSAEMELARAWERLTGLLGLSASTATAVCLLVYLSIYRALRPAKMIVDNLEQMQAADSLLQLPTFKLLEWQRIGTAINAYAATQKQLLSDRKKLALQLMSVQEEERRFLARELHDEFGQCLSAINALSSSIVQTAKQDCPQLVPEAESIAKINRRVMETVRTLLLRLRPAELDELGLVASLHTMVTAWNQQYSGQIHCQLIVDGDLQQLNEPLPIALYRIVQEGLTNIAKHSAATLATVNLKIVGQTIILTIEDNGQSTVFPLLEQKGFGLLGIRERVNGLGGQLDFLARESGGLLLQVTLPKQISIEG